MPPRHNPTPPVQQEEEAPLLPIFQKTASELSKKDVYDIDETAVAQLDKTWREKLKKHIELSNWWKGLNSKAHKNHRKELKHIFEMEG